MAQLVGHCFANQKVAVSAPSQSTCPGCGFGPRLGHLWKAANHCFSPTSMFLSLSFSFPSPLSKIKKHCGESPGMRIFLKKNLPSKHFQNLCIAAPIQPHSFLKGLKRPMGNASWDRREPRSISRKILFSHLPQDINLSSKRLVFSSLRMKKDGSKAPLLTHWDCGLETRVAAC